MEQDNNIRPPYKPSYPAVQGLSRRAVIMAIVLFALVVVGMFTFAFLKKSEIVEEVPAIVDEQPAEEVRYASITRVDAKHFFSPEPNAQAGESGVHTFVGEIPMPTPCDLLQADATVAESYPEQVVIDFTVINNADFCAQTVTPQRFKVSVTASKEATFSARLEGRKIEFNPIPAAPGESPDDFELFIKG